MLFLLRIEASRRFVAELQALAQGLLELNASLL
jgi:hypothetical protein